MSLKVDILLLLLGISEDMNRLLTENTKYCQAVKKELELISARVAEAKQNEPVTFFANTLIYFL